MALVALVIGTSLGAAATERIDLRLIASTSAAWAFVPVLQLLTGLLFVRGARAPVGVALSSYFATHWPWSLWIIVVHAGFVAVPWLRGMGFVLLATALVPVVWTMKLLMGVARETLGLSRRDARWRVGVHEIVTLVLVIAYVQFAVALWPRVLGLLP